jgi:nucleotide-binding universal stress UspA family protein
MNSTWRDIAVFLDGTEKGQKLSRQAASVALRHKAHLVGVYGALRYRGDPSESYARGAGISQVLARHRSLDDSHAVAAGRAFAQLSDDFAISSEFRVVWREAEDEDAALRSLHCDLIVAGHPKPHDLPERWTAEHLLLASGTPVLMIPETWTDKPIGQTVVVAWNGSREVRRAVNDALPFLTAAERVFVVIVNGPRHGEKSTNDHGEEIIRHLQRHEAAAELLEIDSHGLSTPEVLMARSAELGADLMVIGAYSHPRTTEVLFGGVTRSLLAAAPLPLFMSR